MEYWLIGLGAGCIQTIIGQPFDTLKVLRQSGRRIHRNGYYRGFFPSLGISVIQNTVLFTGYEKLYLAHGNHFMSGACAGLLSAFVIGPLEQYKIQHQLKQNRIINLWHGTVWVMCRDFIGGGYYFYSYATLPIDCVMQRGAISGLISWVVSYPFDRKSTEIQSQNKIIIKNMYRGFSFVAIRAMIVNSSIFCYYDWIKRMYHPSSSSLSSSSSSSEFCSK